MSLIRAIDEHRAHFESAGIRGIDLDYLLDLRVDHDVCLASFQLVVSKELARLLEVRAMCTVEQWAWFELMEENDRLEVKTLKKAIRDVKDAFRRNVLKHYKEAIERDRKKAKDRPSEGDQMRAEAVETSTKDLP